MSLTQSEYCKQLKCLLEPFEGQENYRFFHLSYVTQIRGELGGVSFLQALMALQGTEETTTSILEQCQRLTADMIKDPTSGRQPEHQAIFIFVSLLRLLRQGKQNALQALYLKHKDCLNGVKPEGVANIAEWRRVKDALDKEIKAVRPTPPRASGHAEKQTKPSLRGSPVAVTTTTTSTTTDKNTLTLPPRSTTMPQSSKSKVAPAAATTTTTTPPSSTPAMTQAEVQKRIEAMQQQIAEKQAEKERKRLEKAAKKAAAAEERRKAEQEQERESSVELEMSVPTFQMPPAQGAEHEAPVAPMQMMLSPEQQSMMMTGMPGFLPYQGQGMMVNPQQGMPYAGAQQSYAGYPAGYPMQTVAQQMQLLLQQQQQLAQQAQQREAFLQERKVQLEAELGNVDAELAQLAAARTAVGPGFFQPQRKQVPLTTKAKRTPPRTPDGRITKASERTGSKLTVRQSSPQ